MARTLTVATALNLVNARYPKVLTDGFGARFADEVLGYMWTRYPWRESIAELPPFHLTTDESDYGPPLLAVPPDFYALHHARVRSSNSYVEGPMTIHKELPLDEFFAVPTSIAYQKETGSFRVHPIPNVGGAEWWVEGSYKTTYTLVTNENLASYILPWDDLHFPVFRAGLLWKVKDEILGDQKGAAQQFAMFNGQLERMAQQEGLLEGVTVIAPACGLELW